MAGITEVEAKTKWCVQCVDKCEEGFYPCCASLCMAWRWVKPMVVDCEKLGITALPESKEFEPVGHCGLAGPVFL